MFSKKPVLTLLQEEYAKNPKSFENLRHISKQYFEHPGLTTRIFDKFPPLITPEEIKENKKEFIKLISFVKKLHLDAKEDYELKNQDHRNKIEKFQKKIIQQGIRELLSEDGEIKNELIELLEWHPFKEKIKSRAIISAYLGAVNQVITPSHSEISKNTLHLAVLYSYINKNSNNWVKEAIDEVKENKIKKDFEKLRKYSNFFYRNPLVDAAFPEMYHTEAMKIKPITS